VITLSAPIKIALDITNKCNLCCLHCHASANELAGPFLTTEKIFQLITTFKALKIFSLQIGGGEPFVHPDILSILQHAIRQNIHVVMSTNGTLITDILAKTLKDIGITNLQVSLDGATPAVHDKFRGIHGCFEKTLKGIEYLLNVGIAVHIACTLSKNNLHQIPAMVELAYNLGASSFRTMCFMPGGRALSNSELVYCNAEFLQTIEQLRQLREQFRDKVIVSYEMPFIVKEQSIPSKNRLDPIDEYFVGCSAGKRECRILPNGNVVPCPLFGNNPDYIAGNVMQQEFIDIWLNSPVFKKFRAFNYTQKTGKCPQCEFGYICNGGCPAVAVNRTGDFYAPDPRCEYIPGRFTNAKASDQQ
jgi:radical SAM protein with 4Fe4S-binding SPASM domain